MASNRVLKGLCLLSDSELAWHWAGPQAQMEEHPQGTPPSSDPDGGDPHPCPEDDVFFGVPDAESQEEAINRFMEGLEQQECSGFSQIDRLISSLPVPVLKKTRCMSHVSGW